MKMLAYGDVLTIDKPQKVLVHYTFSSGAAETLLGLDEDEICDMADSIWLPLSIPADTTLFVQNFHVWGSPEERELWLVVFEVKRWGGEEFSGEHIGIPVDVVIGIPVDVVNSMQFGSLYSKPVEIKFEPEKESSEDEDIDFSHIK